MGRVVRVAEEGGEAMSQSFFIPGRLLCWFSCGAASAVAAKLAVDEMGGEFDVEVLYCDTMADEHPDNARFMRDVEAWIGLPVKLVRSPRYARIDDVFRGERFINGRHGAPCTRELKRRVRAAYQEPWDYHVFGYTSDEQGRIDQFEEENADLRVIWNLRDRGISKRDCYRIVREAGIELPAMYRLGYKNNNCIGCVKGGAGYWDKVRRDFPEVFAARARVEREIGHSILRVKGEPCFLDELPMGVGRYESEPDIECGPQCIGREREKEESDMEILDFRSKYPIAIARRSRA